MVHSSIHLLKCIFFEVQVACNVLQQLMKFLNLFLLFHTQLNGKKGLSSLILYSNSIHN